MQVVESRHGLKLSLLVRADLDLVLGSVTFVLARGHVTVCTTEVAAEGGVATRLSQ